MFFTPHSRKACLVAVIVFGMTGVKPVLAQNAAMTSQQMVSMAGLIFSGRVVAIEPIRSPVGTVVSMRISIYVEQAFRGVRAGDTIAVNEWAGLWQNSGDRYRVGQRLMLFLYAPSRASLTSPVGQELGRLPVEGRRLILSPAQGKIWFNSRARVPHRIQLRQFVRRMRDSMRRENEVQ